jgi:histidyl-tRNA synthetase
VMEELNLFRASSQTITQLLICNFDKAAENYSLPLLQQFRNAGIATELYPEAAKLKKQMTYADQKKIPYVLLVGSEEMQSGLLQLKNMETGEQTAINAEGVISTLMEI